MRPPAVIGYIRNRDASFICLTDLPNSTLNGINNYGDTAWLCRSVETDTLVELAGM